MKAQNQRNKHISPIRLFGIVRAGMSQFRVGSHTTKNIDKGANRILIESCTMWGAGQCYIYTPMFFFRLELWTAFEKKKSVRILQPYLYTWSTAMDNFVVCIPIVSRFLAWIQWVVWRIQWHELEKEKFRNTAIVSRIVNSDKFALWVLGISNYFVCELSVGVEHPYQCQ